SRVSSSNGTIRERSPGSALKWMNRASLQSARNIGFRLTIQASRRAAPDYGKYCMSCNSKGLVSRFSSLLKDLKRVLTLRLSLNKFLGRAERQAKPSCGERQILGDGNRAGRRQCRPLWQGQRCTADPQGSGISPAHHPTGKTDSDQITSFNLQPATSQPTTF